MRVVQSDGPPLPWETAVKAEGKGDGGVSSDILPNEKRRRNLPSCVLGLKRNEGGIQIVFSLNCQAFEGWAGCSWDEEEDVHRHGAKEEHGKFRK